ncbi:hypothetical protein QS308_16395 [Paraburkholderia bonniea]|uniref:hypothetical protein n=1 Tax=Paraburkholderia bonniea TaxID=2152891 RepID=UPI00257325A3|nr:hypothetical protein [Paraburkholderia bonniea]WJF94972.1 hypothetical protein QS308_16395 [Paraburkholderia bonniea]
MAAITDEAFLTGDTNNRTPVLVSDSDIRAAIEFLRNDTVGTIWDSVSGGADEVLSRVTRGEIVAKMEYDALGQKMASAMEKYQQRIVVIANQAKSEKVRTILRYTAESMRGGMARLNNGGGGAYAKYAESVISLTRAAAARAALGRASQLVN